MIKKPKMQTETQALQVSNADQSLLIEIGTEELPAKALPALEKQFSVLMQQVCAERGLALGNCQSFSTPRRLALLIQHFPSKEPDTQTVKRGPSLTAAYDAEGKPSPAALAFAHSVDTPLEKLSIQETPKGKWLIHASERPGRSPGLG
jgi:glycyl-tRNA synthetase beta chain